MTINEYQSKAEETALYPYDQFPEQGLFYTTAGMVAEAGEMMNKVKKLIRGDKVLNEQTRQDLKDELGDVLWYVAMTARELDFPLDAVAQCNVDKLYSRKERGVIKGDGDKR